MYRVNAVQSSPPLAADGNMNTTREAALALGVDLNRLPRHVAFIMDGNGRWAKRRGRKRTWGHRAGVETAREMILTCRELDIPVMTLYAFSTENWNRSPEEVDFLMRLLENVTKRECMELKRKGARLQFLGDMSKLPSQLQKMFNWAAEETKHNSSLILNLAVNYGGRQEITMAARKLAEAVRGGELHPADIDEDALARFLYTTGLPDPDLLVRTSGEMRVSNYLLWQIAYAEIWVTDTCWPDLRQPDFLRAIYDYQQRIRNFGH